MNKSQVIADNMFLLGNEFTKLAAESTTSKQRTANANLAFRAYDLYLKASKDTVTDINSVYLLGISLPIPRAELFRNYIEYCVNNSVTPLAKGVFFKIAEAKGFTFSVRSGEWIANPKGSTKRISALKAAKAKQIS